MRSSDMPQARAVDVIAFGSVFLEAVFGDVPALPGPGEEVFTGQFGFSCGGGALTVATAAAQLGVHAGMAALLGDDLGSRIIARHCRRVGVDMSACRWVSGPAAGVSVAVNFDGDRAFISHLPQVPGRHDFGHWLEVLRTQRPQWCYLHARPGAAPFIREAGTLGARVAVAVSLDSVADHPGDVVDCVREADIFLSNEAELLRLTGTNPLDAALAQAVAWCPCVVVTRGAGGAVVAQPDGTTHVHDGILPVEARDRTGAGDAFAGGLLGALCQGAAIADAAVAGNRAGSRTVSVLGAVGEVPMDGIWEEPEAWVG
jgi:sugar/nucleoside kinase (ribokinase family)